MNKREVQHTIDTGFSNLEFTPDRKREVLSIVKGEKIVKKKISAAMVFIVIMVLITLTALAAVMLSGKEFVEEVIAPMAIESTTERWTREEIDSILRIVDENEISLSEDMLSELKTAEGKYKEEMMRSFLKLELGLYPATWSIEDQAWYDALLVDCGLAKEQTRFVPTGNEVSFEQALGIAISNIKAKYGEVVDVDDEMHYQRFVEYRRLADQDSKTGEPKWYVEYKALDPSRNTYCLTITSDGVAEEINRVLGMKNAEGVPSIETVFDYYTEEYGYHYQWSQDVWASLQHDIERAVIEHGHNGNLSAILLRQEYGTPDAQAIPMEKAIEIALSAISQESGIPEPEFVKQYTAKALYLIDASGPIWKVSFVSIIPNGAYTFTLRYAEVDAHTGFLQNIGHYQPGTNDWFEAYVLESTLNDDSDASSHG